MIRWGTGLGREKQPRLASPASDTIAPTMAAEQPPFSSPSAAAPSATVRGGAAASHTSRWTPRGIAAGCLAAGGLAFVAAAVLAAQVPDFYARARGAEPGEAAETRARRAVSKTSAWHAAISRPGGWDTAIAAEELNAWLATDLPRNHAGWLPRGISQPRLAFSPRHLAAGVRVGFGPVATVASVDCEIVLREPNQLAIVVERARLGAIPLPTAPILGEIGRRLRKLGMVTDIRPVDGRMVLAVYIPSTHDAGATSYWLESMSFTDGEWLVSGTTRVAAARRASLPAPTR